MTSEFIPGTTTCETCDQPIATVEEAAIGSATYDYVGHFFHTACGHGYVAAWVPLADYIADPDRLPGVIVVDVINPKGRLLKPRLMAGPKAEIPELIPVPGLIPD